MDTYIIIGMYTFLIFLMMWTERKKDEAHRMLTKIHMDHADYLYKKIVESQDTLKDLQEKHLALLKKHTKLMEANK